MCPNGYVRLWMMPFYFRTCPNQSDGPSWIRPDSLWSAIKDGNIVTPRTENTVQCKTEEYSYSTFRLCQKENYWDDDLLWEPDLNWLLEEPDKWRSERGSWRIRADQQGILRSQTHPIINISKGRSLQEALTCVDFQPNIWRWSGDAICQQAGRNECGAEASKDEQDPVGQLRVYLFPYLTILTFRE